MRLLMLVAALLAAAPALATQVILEADTRELEVGQTSNLTLSVVEDTTWAEPKDVPHIEAPQGLEITYANARDGTGQVNFRVRRVKQYVFRITAVTAGSYSLGPVPVEFDKGTVTTNALGLRVVPRPTAEEPPLQAEAEFLAPQAWEGQVVLYRYRLYSRVRILRSQWNLPGFEGLVAPRDGNRPRREYRLEDADGAVGVDESYIPLVVTGRGDLAQPAAVVRVDVPERDSGRRDLLAMFAPTRTEVLATATAALEARPLPPAPAGFSGLVGDFAFTARADRARVAVGESVTVQIEARGDGTLEGFKLPPPQQVPGARVYDGSPAVEASVTNEAYLARGTYGRVVVATREGALAIPPIEIVTFSPTRGVYVTHRLEVPPITVAPGREGDLSVESFSAGQGARPARQQVEVQDIRDPRGRGMDRLWPIGPALPFLLGAAAAPGVILLIGTLMTSARRRMEDARRRRPPPSPSQRVRRLPLTPEARLLVLDGALREAVSLHADAAPDLRDRAEGLLRALDRVRFGGAGAAPDLEAQVREAVFALEAR